MIIGWHEQVVNVVQLRSFHAENRLTFSSLNVWSRVEKMVQVEKF